ncbi:hypothetical protein HS088_TW05G00138 [Tripterygium wilfordii]|uniref:Uncharacterized protein n=1 Tax=Tripterygium wilfordii TaxID=458696 RepID=A0A7J7DM62_TRIWF|nr:hypothetical protein HS088_TW05G00138 [Tripterygium wilfordii]
MLWQESSTEMGERKPEKEEGKGMTEETAKTENGMTETDAGVEAGRGTEEEIEIGIMIMVEIETTGERGTMIGTGTGTATNDGSQGSKFNLVSCRWSHCCLMYHSGEEDLEISQASYSIYMAEETRNYN